MFGIRKTFSSNVRPLYAWSAILLLLLGISIFWLYRTGDIRVIAKRIRNMTRAEQTQKGTSSAEGITFTKKYSYDAIETDNKLSARTMALATLKTQLVEEVASYVTGRAKTVGLNWAKDRMTAISSALVGPEVVNERWNGNNCYMAARFSISADEVLDKLQTVSSDPDLIALIEGAYKKTQTAFESVKNLRDKISRKAKVPEVKYVMDYNEKIKALISAGLVEKAYGLLISDKYDEAIQAFNEAIKSSPEDAELYVDRGRASLRNSPESAIKDFTYAHLLDPTNIDSINYLGNMLSKTGNYQAAAAVFEKAVTSKYFRRLPASVQALLLANQGAAYSGMGSYESAFKSFSTALILDIHNPYIYTMRGITLNKLGRYDEAIEDFNEAVRFGTESAETYYNRGRSYLLLDKFDWAVTDFNDAIKLDPGSADAYLQRGLAYSKLNQTWKAMGDYRKATEINPSQADGYYYSGLEFQKLEKMNQAIQEYTKAIGTDPGRPEFYNNRGQCYLETGNFKKAIMDFSIVVELAPDSSDTYISRGHAFFRLGMYAEAIVDYDRASALAPFDPLILNRRGKAHFYTGKTDHAVKDFSKAIELDSSYAEPYNNLGKAYSFLGDYERALPLFNTAIELNHPDIRDVYYNRGRAYYNRGDFEKAANDFRKAPENEYARIQLMLATRRVSSEGYYRELDTLRDFVMTHKSVEWIRTISRYYLGFQNVSEDTILKELLGIQESADVRDRLCQAYYYLAEKRLISEEREKAKELFIKAIDTKPLRCMERSSAEAMLKSMEKQRGRS